MKFLAPLLVILPVALAQAPTCKTGSGNNCARAVTGTAKAPDQASRRADCSSYMKATVTPAAATVTTTVTITVNAKRGIDARQVTVVPSAIPTYASAACSAAAYSSVCHCWGITATTLTVATPTVTVTATATATAVADCPGGGQTCGTYTLYNCPESDYGLCTCGIDPSGATVCHAVSSCGNPTCSSNADCAEGSFCLTQSCCGGNICAARTPGRCINATLPRSIFGRKVAGEARAASCNSASAEC